MEGLKNPQGQAVEDTAAVPEGDPGHAPDPVTAGDATQGPAADPVIVAAATQGPAAEASGKMTGPGAAQDRMTGMVADQIESC